MKPFDSLRILEIGEIPFVSTAFPAQTVYFDAQSRQSNSGPDSPANAVATLRDLIGHLRSGRFDVIVATKPPSMSPWRLDLLVRELFSRRAAASRLTPSHPYGFQVLRWFRDLPLAVLDFDDSPHVERSQFYLLDRAGLYFKRELPPDPWDLFYRTGTARHPSRRFRQSPRFVRRVAKLRPLAVGMHRGSDAFLPREPVAKTADIFFAGDIAGLPIRQRALAELDVLRAEGFAIDTPRERLPRDEFFRRCAAARLVLSPAGYGWECFRHYEAAACGSVPLMNLPTILRHAPTTHGVDAFFYPPEPGGLATIARQALADREKLQHMGAAAKAHFEKHHTAQAIARHVILETLAASRPA